MQLTSFEYTKADGTTSKRVIIVTGSPSQNYSGIDISEVSTEDQALYTVAYEKIKAEHDLAIRQLNKEFEMQHRYRQFKPAGMSNIETHTL